MTLCAGLLLVAAASRQAAAEKTKTAGYEEHPAWLREIIDKVSKEETQTGNARVETSGEEVTFVQTRTNTRTSYAPIYEFVLKDSDPQVRSRYYLRQRKGFNFALLSAETGKVVRTIKGVDALNEKIWDHSLPGRGNVRKLYLKTAPKGRIK